MAWLGASPTQNVLDPEERKRASGRALVQNAVVVGGEDSLITHFDRNNEEVLFCQKKRSMGGFSFVLPLSQVLADQFDFAFACMRKCCANSTFEQRANAGHIILSRGAQMWRKYCANIEFAQDLRGAQTRPCTQCQKFRETPLGHGPHFSRKGNLMGWKRKGCCGEIRRN
ncbi:hypothetical protein K438DRAFT_1760159 [Mycena galopus ATCC 62051]|nr:hypothetical protein K438DRAFT_1760159 [Mycena galopus ATCC 62051]